MNCIIPFFTFLSPLASYQNDGHNNDDNHQQQYHTTTTNSRTEYNSVHSWNGCRFNCWDFTVSILQWFKLRRTGGVHVKPHRVNDNWCSTLCPCRHKGHHVPCPVSILVRSIVDNFCSKYNSVFNTSAAEFTVLNIGLWESAGTTFFNRLDNGSNNVCKLLLPFLFL